MRTVAYLLLLSFLPLRAAAQVSWDSLLATADRWDAAKNQDSALAYAIRALHVADSVCGPLDTNVAVIYGRLGLLQSQTHPDQSESCFRKALMIWDSVPNANPQRHARTLNNLGILSQRDGRYDEAEQCFQRALDLKRRFLPPNHTDLATTLNNLAVFYIERGKYPEADRALEQAATIWRQNPGFDSSAYLLNRSALCLHQFRYEECIEAAREAVRLCQVTQHIGGIARAASSIARAYAHLGRLASADSVYSEILRYCDTSSVAAKDWFLGEERIGIIVDAAQIKTRLGQNNSASDLLEKADSLAAAILPANHRRRYYLLCQHGQVEFNRSRYGEALDYYRRAAEHGDTTIGPTHPDLATSYEGLAECSIALGRFEDAFREARKASDILYAAFPSLAAAVSDDEALSYAAELAKTVGLVLQCLKRTTRSDPGDFEYTANLILRTKGIASEVLLARHQELAGGSDSTVRRLHERRRFTAKALTDAVLGGQPGVDALSRRKNIDSLQREYQRTCDRLSLTDIGFGKQMKLWSVTANDVRRALPRGALALEYYAFDSRDTVAGREYAVVVMDADHTRLIWLSSPGKIDSLVTSYVDHMKHVAAQRHAPTASDVRDYLSIARVLHAEVLGPVTPLLEGKRSVFISCAGALSFVPFQTLCDERGLYVAESLDVHCLDATRELTAATRVSAIGHGLLALGDPDFDKSTETSVGRGGTADHQDGTAAGHLALRGGCALHLESLLEPLPGTRLEIGRISADWPVAGETVETLLGPEASEGNFKRLAPSHRILHVATHGFLLGQDCESDTGAARGRGGSLTDANPMLTSGLLLAGARSSLLHTGETSREDGILSALEIEDLDLAGVELVTLSSCESGLGVLYNTEGFYGLRRAFALAGARAVLASLWQVPDEATATLMSGIYSRVDLPLADAVRAAEIGYLSRLRAAGLADHPFLWGAFVPYGEWSARH